MGGKMCTECQNPSSKQPAYLAVGDLSDPDQPQRSYAFPQSVKYEVPCNVSHIFSQIPQIKYGQHIERGKKYDNSYFLVPFSVYYTGQWKKGRPHGVGDVVFQNGSVLKGSFDKGEVKGDDCLLVMEDGSFYRGNIQKNKFCKKGFFKQQNGHQYEGQWDNNVPHGYGVQKFANGDKFQGQFQNGVKKCSKGRYVWANHPEFAEYVGQFADDYMNGQGILRKKNGTEISGIFNKNYISDAHIKNNDYQYNGEVRNGFLDGNGKIKFLSDKRQYEGKFKDGQPHGLGTLTLPNGTKKSGNWFKGNLIRDYKGLTQTELQKCLIVIQNQLQNKVYMEDAVQNINYELKSLGYKNIETSIIENEDVKKIAADKYLLVDMGNKTLLIKSKA